MSKSLGFQRFSIPIVTQILQCRMDAHVRAGDKTTSLVCLPRKTVFGSKVERQLQG